MSTGVKKFASQLHYMLFNPTTWHHGQEFNAIVLDKLKSCDWIW